MLDQQLLEREGVVTEELRFDVAISHASEDAWVACDLHNLIKRNGFSVYCDVEQADAAGGFLRENLQAIFRTSTLNVLIWSRAYAQKPVNSICGMERRSLVERHVNRGDAGSLVIVNVDDAPLGDLDVILVHHLKTEGLTRIEEFITTRLKRLWSRPTESGLLKHPPGTEKDRGLFQPSVFTIDPKYQSDPLGRWKTLADVLVQCEIPGNRLLVYLIPSGLATPFLRHSALLRSDPTLLERKRRATEKFAEDRLGCKLEGFWFRMKKGEIELPTVYCPSYDAFLNASLQEI